MSASWSGESSSSFGLHESSQQELYDLPAASEDDPASAVEFDASVAGAAVLVQELNWNELLQVLVENWPWLLYAVVWKLNPHNQSIVWHQGKFNGGNLQPPGALLQQHDPAAESRRLEAIFYTVYKSCTFTISPSSGYAARALFQESPLWWTNDMPRLVTEERKDQFLQQSGIKTMVCFPGRGSDGNIYCLEIASTHLILETSELLQTFKQLFMSGSSVFPSLSPLESVVLLPAAGGSSSSSRGGHVEIAAATAWFHAHNYGTAAAAPREVPAPHAFGNRMQSPSWDGHELGILDPDDDHEEIARLQQQQEVFTQLESMDSAAAGRSTAAADAISNFMQLQPTMAVDSVLMQAYQNIYQLDSETTDPAAAVAALQHPPAMSSVINFAALFDTVFGTNSDPAIVSSSCNDDDDDQVQDLEPFHDLLQQQQPQNITLGHHDGHELAQQSSAAMSTNPYEIMYSDPELQSPAADASTSTATSVRPAAQPDSCLPDRLPRATDQLVVDPAMDLHHGANFLDLDAEPAAAVKNPFDHHRQQQQNPSGEQCSPFKSLEPSRRLSKRRRLDAVDNSMQRSETASGIFGAAAAAAAGPSSTAPPPPPRPRQSMIELWTSLSGRIQESDRIQRVDQRVQETLMRSSSSSRDAHAGDTSALLLQQLQLQGAAGAAAVSRSTSDDLRPAPGRGLFDLMSRDVLDQLQTYNIPADWQAPVAHVDQAQIAEKHKMKERDRRSRIKTEINALDSLLPASKKKDTLSILTKAIHYIRQLKDQIAAVRVEKAGSATFLQQQTHDRPAVVQEAAAAAAAAPASGSIFSSINNLSSCSTRVAVRPAEAHVIADGASNSRDLVIDVKSRNNPQTLIQILSMVRDSALEVGSLSSDDARVIQGRMAFSLTVPVPSSLQQTPLYCDKVKEAVEREILQNIAAHDTTSSRLHAPSDASPESETPTETLTPSPGVKKHKGMSEPSTLNRKYKEI